MIATGMMFDPANANSWMELFRPERVLRCFYHHEEFPCRYVSLSTLRAGGAKCASPALGIQFAYCLSRTPVLRVLILVMGELRDSIAVQFWTRMPVLARKLPGILSSNGVWSGSLCSKTSIY